MQIPNKMLEDVSQLMINATRVAQDAKQEAETAVKSLMERWIADQNLVARDEFEAVKAMAGKAREENKTLKERIEILEKAISENQHE